MIKTTLPTGESSVTAPDGKVHVFESPQDARAFMAKENKRPKPSKPSSAAASSTPPAPRKTTTKKEDD